MVYYDSFSNKHKKYVDCNPTNKCKNKSGNNKKKGNIFIKRETSIETV